MRFVAKQGDLEVTGEAEACSPRPIRLATAYRRTSRWSVFEPITVEERRAGKEAPGEPGKDPQAPLEPKGVTITYRQKRARP